MLNHDLVRAILEDRRREIERAIRERALREALTDQGATDAAPHGRAGLAIQALTALAARSR
jgi:hypothetical protein